MRLCLVGNFGISYGQISDDLHLANALEAIGHEVVKIPREQFLSRMDETFPAFAATIFFKWRGFVPEDIKAWRKKTNAPILAWTFDFMLIHDYFLPVLKEVDLWLGEELGLLPKWKEMGAWG